MSERVLSIAHRAANEPELLSEAFAAGADVVEADIWPYRGQLEVRHLKTMGRIPLLWDKWKLASARTPRRLMAEMLESLPQDVGLMLDLKGHDREAAGVVAATMRHVTHVGQLYVCARDWGMLDPFAESGGTIVHSAGKAYEVARLHPLLESGACKAVSVHQKLLTPALVGRFRKNAAIVMTWPVNDVGRMRELVDWGVNGITTDSLAVVRAMRSIEDERTRAASANDDGERGQ